MAPLPYTDSGAQIAFYVFFAVFVLLELRIRVRSRLNRHGSRSERASLVALYAAVYAGMLGAVCVRDRRLAVADSRCGIGPLDRRDRIRQWAVAVLGHFFTTDVRVHPGQTVVDRGPYRWVRHPSYTGMIMTFVGVGLALGNWAALAVLAVVPTAGLSYASASMNPPCSLAPYRRFAASRPHLVPGLW